MKLTLSELKTITKGCLDLWEDEHGFRFRRMTEKQLAAVDDIPRYRMRSRFCAGVRLDFWTDAAELSFDYELLALDENRYFYGFDVWVDGVLEHTYFETPAVNLTGNFRCPLGAAGELRHVTLYLPHSGDCAISNVTFGDAALLERAEDTGGLLLTYGDSITQGYDAIHPSMTYAALLSRSLGLELLNQGISGYVFDRGTVDAEHVPLPEAVTVAYGTNDWTNKGSLSEVRADMDRYLDDLVQAFPQSRLYVILPIWRGDTAQPTPVGEFAAVREALRASAQRYPAIRILDSWPAVPHVPDFFADEAVLHPNDAGMLCYARWLIGQIEAELAQQNGCV